MSKDLVKYVRNVAINFEEGDNYKDWVVINEREDNETKMHSADQAVNVENENATIYLEGLFKKVSKFKDENRKRRRTNQNFGHVAENKLYGCSNRNAQDGSTMLCSGFLYIKDIETTTTPENTKTKQNNILIIIMWQSV